MLNRLLLFLLLCSAFLQAQDTGQWQSYAHSGSLIAGAETDEHIWLATSNYLLQLDRSTGTEKIHHFSENGLFNNILDIWSTGQDDVIALTWRNKLQYWHNGQWTEQQLQPSNPNLFLYKIIGKDAAGRVLLRTTDEIYALTPDGELEWLSINAQIYNHIQFAKIDLQGRLWVSSSYALQCYSPSGELLFNYSLSTHQPTDLEIDLNGNVWLASGRGLYIWNNSTEELHLDVNIAGNIQLYVTPSLPTTMILYNYADWTQVTYQEDGSFSQQTIPLEFSGELLFTSIPYLDQSGKFWFSDHLLRIWQWDYTNVPTPKEVFFDSWIPFQQVSEMALDQQGKVWVGGTNGLAYLMGGRWNLIPLIEHDFATEIVNTIQFNREGNPIVGVSTIHFFGFPEAGVREWNGASWDTLEQAVLPNTFASDLDLELDGDENLWLVLFFDDEFSVRYQEQWYRYPVSDLPVEVNAFLCLQKAPDGTMWLGTDNGILNFDGFQFKHTSAAELGISGAEIYDITFDQEGNMWLAAGPAGIIRQVGDSWVKEEIPYDTHPDPIVQGIITGPHSEVWATLAIEGVLHYDGKEWDFWNHENTEIFAGRIDKVLPDPQGRVWFASGRGVNVYAPGKLPIEPFQRASSDAVRVYPNPGCCQFRVHWEAKNAGAYSVQLHQLDGQLLRQWPLEVSDVGETYFDLKDYSLPPGTHLISVYQDTELIGTSLLLVIQ